MRLLENETKRKEVGGDGFQMELITPVKHSGWVKGFKRISRGFRRIQGALSECAADPPQQITSESDNRIEFPT